MYKMHVIKELKIVKVFIDKKLMIDLTKNSVFRGRSKHIENRFHLFVNVSREVKLLWSSSE